MRLPLIFTIIVLLFGIRASAYIYSYGRKKNWFNARWKTVSFWVLPILTSVGMIVVAASSKKSADDREFTALLWTLFAYFSVYVPILIMAIFCLLRHIISLICKRRWLRWITVCGALSAVGVFVAMWWGVLVTRYRLDVRQVEVPVAGLPAAFEGYRIAQISDIHSGSYAGNPKFLEKMVECINDQHPDIILFTGDIVNRHAEELLPYTSALAGLSAPDGVWSVMGNHDYSDYYSWPNLSDKIKDVDRLQQIEADMGWKMLNNDYTTVRRDSDSLVVIGVENIGEPPFHTYGSLERAYPHLNDSAVKILMSHNPRHWVDSIADNRQVNIALTLSGHTHAMQMKIFGWSPSALKYKTWGGLYPDSLNRHLYVNIGIGEVGFPARIGATPEVTILTLRRTEE